MQILTAEQFAEARPGTIRNYALKRGGSIDVGTRDGQIIVGSKRELTPDELTEATAIVENYTTRQAKLSKDKEHDKPQAGRAVHTPAK